MLVIIYGWSASLPAGWSDGLWPLSHRVHFTADQSWPVSSGTETVCCNVARRFLWLDLSVSDSHEVGYKSLSQQTHLLHAVHLNESDFFFFCQMWYSEQFYPSRCLPRTAIGIFVFIFLGISEDYFKIWCTYFVYDKYRISTQPPTGLTEVNTSLVHT